MVILWLLRSLTRRSGKPLRTRSLTKTVRSILFLWPCYDPYIFPPATLKNDDADDSGDEGDGEDDELLIKERKLLQSEKRTSEKQPTGRIVGIIKRNWRAYVCHIDSTSLTSSNATSLSQQTVFATPVSRLLPRIRLRTRQAPTLIGQKILVTIDRWDVTSRYPEGHFVRALGKVESKEAEQESLLLEFEVPYRPFGKAILDCLPEQGEQWVVPPKSELSPEWKNREDLRDVLICSIDPPGMFMKSILSHFLDLFDEFFLGCQDIDDALHARQLPNGNIEAGVRKCPDLPLPFFDAALILYPQTSPTYHTLYILIHPWIARQLPEELPYTWSTSALTCCLLSLERIFALCDRSLSDWRFRRSG